MPVSMHARLLRLCDLAYRVELGHRNLSDAKQTALEMARDAEISLAGPFSVVGRSSQSGPDRDTAIIGRFAEGIVIAIRGTQPPKLDGNARKALSVLRDWLNNGDLLNQHSRSFAGFVHGGFGEAANELWADDDSGPGLGSVLTGMLHDGTGPRRVFVTGHSKGGPVANLIAWRIRRDFNLGAVPIEVVTFAAAKPGDEHFRSDFDSRGISGFRYETFDDIVPKLPLGGSLNPDIGALLEHLQIDHKDSVIGFAHVGTEVPERVLVHQDMPGPFGARLLKSVRLLQRIVTIVKAHGIGKGSRYDRLVDDSAQAVAKQRARIFGSA